MKKMMLFCLVMVLMLSSYAGVSAWLNPAATAEEAVVIAPLPDDTMENLTDAILSVSLAEGDVYLDDTGILQMKVKIYTYDQYDLLDIAQLQAGSILATHAGEVKVSRVEQKGNGLIAINGGLEADGLDLMATEGGLYYVACADDAKDWYEIGEATLRVSVDFQGYDQADPELGDVIFFPGSFLVNEVTSYDFTPWNTTIRTEDGQVVELHRAYMP